MSLDPLTPYERQRDRTEVYRQRPHALSPEVEFELTADALVWQDSRNGSGTLPYRDIAELRVYFDPGRIQAQRHVLEVTSVKGMKLKITSTTYRGMGFYKPRNGAFTAFVGDLHARLAMADAPARGRIGRGWLGFVAFLGVWMIAVALVAYGAMQAALVQQWIVAAALGFMAAYFAHLGQAYFVGNLPRDYDVAAPPANLLPAATSSDV